MKKTLFRTCKTFLIVVVIFSLLFFVGCSDSGDKSGSSADNEKNTEETDPPDATDDNIDDSASISSFNLTDIMSKLYKGSVDVRYIGEEKRGYYEVILNYHWDTDYHMGQLYGEKLVSQYPALETGFVNYLSALPDAEYDKIMTRIQLIKNQIPQEYRDFINGLASKFDGGTHNDKNDGVLSVDEVFYFSLIGEVHRSSQCSVIAAYHSVSATHKPIIGRLLDWSGAPHGAVFYINKGRKKIVNIGNSLLSLSVSTGLNKHGIFVATLDAPTGEPYPDLSSDTYYAYHFDLRYALENYHTIYAVARYLSKRKYTYNHLIVIGDGRTVSVLENDLNGRRILRDDNSELNAGITWEFSDAIAAVNVFLLKDNFDNFTGNSANTIRWQSIQDQLGAYLSSNNLVTAEEMKKIATYYGTHIDLSDHAGIMTHITQQIVIYDSANSSLQVFFRNNRSPGTENNASNFDINNPEFLAVPLQF
ncbi:MAG TPA: C45 family autoproteolytic acyltransferase/hydrolase [Smithella sp.]|nr:C45 family autoproteolytic acyltransferase/hydrolase [Smithella sp.]HOU50766.1 C45 family autoproteolytic acyltransferase/hydrolase [Smithella sp.]HQI71950.1 C45 family autoproteolytic acyltransferase/hydrolase [Smithella sp.]